MFFEKLKSLFSIAAKLPTNLPVVLTKHEIKILTLSKQGSNRYALDNFLYKFTVNDLLNNSNIKIKNLAIDYFANVGLNNRKMLLLIPELLIFTEIIELDGDSFKPDKIKDLLYLEIPKRFPFNLEEVYYDYELDNVDKTKTNILIVISPKKNIDRYLQMFSNYKSLSISLPILIEEVIRALNPILHMDKSHLIIDLDYSYVYISLIKGDKIVLIHKIERNIVELIRFIMKVSGLSFEDIEKRLFQVGILNKKNSDVNDITLTKLTTEFIEWLRDEVTKIINYYKSDNKKLDGILLIGKFANIAGLKDYFENNYQITTVIPNPFEINNIKISKSLVQDNLKQELIKFPSAFIESVGIALRSVNLQPEENGFNLLIRK